MIYATVDFNADREIEIFQRLRDVVMPLAPVLLQASNILAEMDW